MALGNGSGLAPLWLAEIPWAFARGVSYLSYKLFPALLNFQTKLCRIFFSNLKAFPLAHHAAWLPLRDQVRSSTWRTAPI